MEARSTGQVIDFERARAYFTSAAGCEAAAGNYDDYTARVLRALAATYRTRVRGTGAASTNATAPSHQTQPWDLGGRGYA
jgi:hypothetical protein